ncbi:hypothetical protein BDY17DRAFT_320776 [Neohortaea acidophila]|uniref:Uncharacterized protein n=1 Tax=Neohortaea acidophila TaxID=245834 RepID=A0A6A6Q3D7_9PEZI|nr:uncharacterized protein BDY17DRAFT_320776 [Neohortaea acidophila]KAF2485937.1 hypothetical protein BDY17DRAFT_320776 [Neohortaea acidophila]
MRLSTSSWLLAGLCCAVQTLAHESLPTPTITPPSGARLDDLIPSATPFPTHPDLRARQNLGVDQNPGAIPHQVPPVTVYSIVSQVGATGAVEIYTYTQLFVAVPDQFPVAQVGTIGYGTDRRRKREAVNTGIAGRIHVP